jgi:hypothetical protein
VPLHVTVADFRRDALLCVVGTGSVHELSQNGAFASKHAHSTASCAAADENALGSVSANKPNGAHVQKTRQHGGLLSL